MEQQYQKPVIRLFIPARNSGKTEGFLKWNPGL